MKKNPIFAMVLAIQPLTHAGSVTYFASIQTARQHCPHHIYFLQDQVLGHKGMMRFVSMRNVDAQPKFVKDGRMISDAHFAQINIRHHRVYGYSENDVIRYCFYGYEKMAGGIETVWLTNR